MHVEYVRHVEQDLSRCSTIIVEILDDLGVSKDTVKGNLQLLQLTLAHVAVDDDRTTLLDSNLANGPTLAHGRTKGV